MPRRQMVTWLVSGELKSCTPEHVELWLEMCARLERIAQDPAYGEILASGDGIPNEAELR